MRRAARILALLVVLSASPAVATTAADPAATDRSIAADRTGDADVRPTAALAAGAGAGTGVGALQTSPPDPNTVIRVRLEPDRDARWTVQFRYRVETENQTAAFRRLVERFEAGTAAAGPNAALFRTAAEKASAVAGREMRIVDVNRTGGVDGDTGVLTLRFTWTDFLERGAGTSLRLGDAFRTPNGGRWLSSLEDGQRIVIVTPDGYTVNSTSFQLQLQNNSVIIDGPRSLPRDERLAVTYRENSRADPPWALIAGGVGLAVLAAAAGAFLYLRRGRGERDRRTPVSSGESTDGGVGVDVDGTAAGGSGDAPTPEGTDEGSGAGPGSESASASDSESEAEVDLSLLSDEERVEHLLERNGGRMKQADIVKETGWSDAKVSQLLSSMTDEDRVEKLRLGRENLISLPDTDEDGHV